MTISTVKCLHLLLHEHYFTIVDGRDVDDQILKQTLEVSLEQVDLSIDDEDQVRILAFIRQLSSKLVQTRSKLWMPPIASKLEKMLGG